MPSALPILQSLCFFVQWLRDMLILGQAFDVARFTVLHSVKKVVARLVPVPPKISTCHREYQRGEPDFAINTDIAQSQF